jgi:hypothetical protein
MTSSSQLQQEVREVQVQTMNGEELQQHLLSQVSHVASVVCSLSCVHAVAAKECKVNPLFI